jgi:CHAT domain-containing protein
LSWQASTDEPVTSYYGQDASEDHFKNDAPGHRIVHLATHGFFLEKSCNPDIPSAGISSGQTFAGENPLLLSGLLFAGANNSGDDSGFARIEDGILTAYEVSSMDLTGAELVVLSACETGLGEVESGEGVYGLRRAFQMAGASSVVSALWPVSDEATAGMMSRLYSGGGKSLAEGMRSIQIEKIEELRSENKSDHPYSWGAFIALGDWRW